MLQYPLVDELEQHNEDTTHLSKIHEIQDHPKSPRIYHRVVSPAQQYLRSLVTLRPGIRQKVTRNGASVQSGRRNKFCEFEVTDDHVSRLVEYNVIWIDITMHDPNRVEVGNPDDLSMAVELLSGQGLRQVTHDFRCVEHDSLRGEGTSSLNKTA